MEKHRWVSPSIHFQKNFMLPKPLIIGIMRKKVLPRRDLIPDIETQREEIDSSSPWLLISDIFKGQWTDHVKEIVRQSNGKMVSVPNNWTRNYQPLDLTINKSWKDFLWKEAQKWYSDQISKQMPKWKNSHEIKVDVALSTIKPLLAKWVVKFYDYIKPKPEIVCNGWQKSGITEKLKEDITLDPFK